MEIKQLTTSNIVEKDVPNLSQEESQYEYESYGPEEIDNKSQTI
jgi:hypothetical protein